MYFYSVTQLKWKYCNRTVTKRSKSPKTRFHYEICFKTVVFNILHKLLKC